MKKSFNLNIKSLLVLKIMAFEEYNLVLSILEAIITFLFDV